MLSDGRKQFDGGEGGESFLEEASLVLNFDDDTFPKQVNGVQRLGRAEWGDIPEWGGGLTEGTGALLGGEFRGPEQPAEGGCRAFGAAG